MARTGKKLRKRADLRNSTVELTWYGDDFLEVVEAAQPGALFSAGNVVLDAARVKAPRRSGEMIKSGHVVTQDKDNYVRQRKDRRNMARIQQAARQPGSVMIAFASWYANLFEDSGRKRNIIPRAARKGGVRRAGNEIRRGQLQIQKALKIPGIGMRASAKIPRMKARPFVGPALEETKDQFVETLADETRRRLEAELPNA